MELQAIVFDLFDTLVDLDRETLPEIRVGDRVLRGSHGALHRVVSGAVEMDLESFVRELRESDREAYATRWGEGRELPAVERFRAFTARIGASDESLAEALCRAHMSVLRSAARVLPHHRDLLHSLGERWRLGVCSNFSHAETALSILEEAGLRDAFDVVVISETGGYRKPRPEIFEETLRGLDVRPGEALHVGDSLSADVAGAARAGLGTAWLTRRVDDPEAALERYDGPAPDRILSDLSELPSRLDSD